MRAKTKYREIHSSQPDKLPADEKELPKTVIPTPQEAPAVAVQVETPATSDASEALKRQLEAQQRAELSQRQRTMAMQSPELMRAARLEEWKPNLSEIELEHLKRNPDWVDYPQITNLAATEALQMHERNSEPYFTAVRERFDAHMNNLRNTQPAQQPTPKFFEPPPPPAPPSRSHVVSAPVSRGVPGASRDSDSPGRVHLSSEELEVARAAGISATRYAEGKILLAQQKARGERQT